MEIENIKDLDARVRYASEKGAAWDASGATCIGGRPENQDSFSYRFDDSGRNLMLVVCDGMGGMKGGAVASTVAVSSIYNDFVKSDFSKINEETLRTLVSKANEAVYSKATEEPSLRGMGTTAVVVVITEEAAFVAHVGDSRIYQLRNGKKKFRTFDHSKVFEMVALGVMTEEEARNASYSNIITRALGLRPEVKVDVEKIPYKKGDRFILCSDGIWNCLPEPEVIKLFNKYDSAAKEMEFMIKTVDQLGEKKGGKHDNLTFVAADMLEDSSFQYGFWHNLKTFFSRCGNILSSLFRKKKHPYKNI